MSPWCVSYLILCAGLWAASDLRTQTIPLRYALLGLVGALAFPIFPLHALLVFVGTLVLLDLPGGDRNALTAIALYGPSPWDPVAIFLGAEIVAITILIAFGNQRCWFMTPFFPFLAVGVGAMLWLRSIVLP